MNPDNFQQAWQAHSAETRITVDAGLLRKEVERNQRDFSAMIFRRDLLEVGIGLLLLPYWIYKGLTNSLPWTWWLGVPAILWVIGYFVVDRVRHPQTPGEPGEPLVACVKNSLKQIEHQIWLLRNVFWWYLLPFTIAILAFFGQVTWKTSRDWLEVLGTGGASFGFLVLLYSFIDYINQRAVRDQLEPRREELLTLLAGLDEEEAAKARATMNNVQIVRSSGVLRRSLVVAAVCAVILVAMAWARAKEMADSNYDGPPRSSGPAGDALAKQVAQLRREKKLIGLAAMVTVDGKLVASAADGERKKGSGVSVELGDRWHLGGASKSITATMIARLVEAGKMRWSDTIGELFPEAKVHEDWKPVTLKQLLTDTAGAPAGFPSYVKRQRPTSGHESTEARLGAVLGVISRQPEYPPGTKYVYSNVGYTIATSMAEKVTGQTWEELMRQEVFEALRLGGVGFGPPRSADEMLEQPRGHRVVRSSKVAARDDDDNTSIIGPAATVHMTLDDLSTFATEHLRGDLGKGQLLSAETYKLLHTPELYGHAFGWIKNEPGKVIPHAVFWHNGSNTMWYALVVFIPETKMVIAVASNDGDSDQAERAAWEIVYASVEKLGIEAEREGR